VSEEGNPTGKAESNLDETNLMQALKDFEVANARVVDLTSRLSSANEEIARLRAALLRAEADVARLSVDNAYYAAVAQGLPFKASRKLTAVAQKALRK